MWKTFTRLALASSLGLAVASGGAPAHAQPRPVNEETARIAFTEGLHPRDVEHEPGKALVKFTAAYKLAATPRTAYELASTHMLLGDWLAAQRLFLEVGRMPPDPLQSAAGRAAREESRRLERELEDRIPAIAIELVGAWASGSPEVAVDGVTVPPEALSLPWKVNPGTHTVAVRVAGEAERARSITVLPGKTVPVAIDVGAIRAWRTSTSAAEPAKSRSNALAFLLGGAGVLAAGAGAALAVSAKSAYDAARQNECGAAIGAPSDQQCSDQGVADRRAAGARADVATVLVGVGVAAVGAGAILWLTAPSSKDVGVGLAASGVVVRGDF